jgi:hypothetical protein
VAATLILALSLTLAQAVPPPDSQAPADAPVVVQTPVATQPPVPAPAAAQKDPVPEFQTGAVQIEGPWPGQAPKPGQPAAQQPAQTSDVQGEAAEGQATGPQPLDTLVRAPVVRPFEMPAYAPHAPMAYDAPPPKAPDTAVTVENYRHSYEGPDTEEQRYYQAGVESHFHMEQSMMGALDGLWTVTDRSGAPVVNVVLNDVGGAATVEGAWRDPRAGGPNAMGVLDSVSRDRSSVTLTFHKPDGSGPTVLKLHPGAYGRWDGDIEDGGARRQVVMNRLPQNGTPPGTPGRP